MLWGLVNTEEHAMLKVLPTYHLGPQSGAIGKHLVVPEGRATPVPVHA